MTLAGEDTGGVRPQIRRRRTVDPFEGLVPCCSGRKIVPPDFRDLDDEPDAASLERESRRRAAGLLDRVVDAHVHLFPAPFYRALERWFDAHAWNIRFRGDAEGVLDALGRSGVEQVVALVYAHKPGVAALLNAFLGGLCRAHPHVRGMGAVLPGEPGAVDVVRDAVRVHGLHGIKLHTHVQRMAVDSEPVLEILRTCAALRVPAVVHAGREPASDAYGVDTHAICSAERTARALRAVPGLTLVVPHLGADEIEAHCALLEAYPGLHLDTSMACAEYFDAPAPWPLVERWSERVLFGTDFPIVPYDPGRERAVLARRIVDDMALDRILRGNARRLFGT